MNKPKLQLIAGWHRALRLTSVQAASLLVVLSMLQTDALPYLQALVSPHAWPWITAGFGIAIAVLRIVAQPTALVDPEGAAEPQEPAP